MSIKPNTKEEMAAVCLLDDDAMVRLTALVSAHNAEGDRTDFIRKHISLAFNIFRYDPVLEPEPLECWMVEEDNGYKWSTLSAGIKTRAERLGHKVSHMTPATLDADVLREHAKAYAKYVISCGNNFTEPYYEYWITEQEGNGDE